MVDFEAGEEPADADAVVSAGARAVGVGDDDDFVSAGEELGPEHVDVVFDAADVGVEEVADHAGRVVIGRERK